MSMPHTCVCGTCYREMSPMFLTGHGSGGGILGPQADEPSGEKSPEVTGRQPPSAAALSSDLRDTQSVLAAAGRRIVELEECLKRCVPPNIRLGCDECGDDDSKCGVDCYVRKAWLALYGSSHKPVEDTEDPMEGI